MMMTCLETDACLPQYLAGGLSQLERDELRQHLSICRICARHAAELRAVRQTIGRFAADTPEPSASEVPLALIQAILEMAESPPDWQQF